MRLWIGVACVAVFIAASAAMLRLEASRQKGVFQTIPPTPYSHYKSATAPRGRVLVVHGLDCSKEVVNLFSLGVRDGGYDVYSIDLPGHGDSTVGFEALRAEKVVADVLDMLGRETVVIGHSLGAAFLLDLANEREFKTMVLLSPPPMPLEILRAERVLVMTGAFDLPKIKAFAPQLQSVATGTVDARTVQWAGHSGALFRPHTIREIVEWLGGDAVSKRLELRLVAIALMLLSSLGLGIVLVSGKAPPNSEERAVIDRAYSGVPSTLVYYAGAAFAAMLVLSVFPILGWLRLYATDYLLGAVFLTGLGLMIRRPDARWRHRAMFQAFLAAAYLIAVPGLVVASRLVHFALSDGRLWRFVAIALASLPLFIADEVFLRPIRPWWKAAATAILTRLLLAAFILTGVSTLNREDAFLVLIVHLVVLFWTGLWLAGELVRRRTGDAMATAVFGALVQGWAFAAIFVKI